MDEELFEEIITLLREGKNLALCTIIDKEGSTPRGAGAKMVVTQINSKGTVGGGELEYRVIEDARKNLKDGSSKLVEYSLEEMGCGGSLKVFIDVVKTRPRLIIFGSGHVARYLAKLGDMEGFRIWIIDNREDYRNDFPSARFIYSDLDLDQLELDMDENTYIVIMTRKHEFDEHILKKVVESDAAYIGMIGSKEKVRRIFENLKREGKSGLDEVHAPIGLDIGAESPEEIALSIMAEIVQLRRRCK